MIVNAKQYEALRHEMLKTAAPSLWKLLSLPFESRTPHIAVTQRWQRRALAELRKLARIEVPGRLFLDFDDEPVKKTEETGR